MGMGVARPLASVFAFCVILYKTLEVRELQVSEQWPASGMRPSTGLTPGHHCLHWISQSAHLRKKVEVKAEIPEASKHCGVPL